MLLKTREERAEAQEGAVTNVTSLSPRMIGNLAMNITPNITLARRKMPEASNALPTFLDRCAGVV